METDNDLEAQRVASQSPGTSWCHLITVFYVPNTYRLRGRGTIRDAGDSYWPVSHAEQGHEPSIVSL